MTGQAEDVLGTAAGWLAEGERVALATVTETWGSSPRPSGSPTAITASGRVRAAPGPGRGTWISASTCASTAPSLRWPPVTIVASGRPRPSTAWWILVVSPPRERPMP